MSANPLVATAQAGAVSPLSGTFIFDDCASLVDSIKSGDWLGASLSAVSGAMDAAATVSDPIGSLIAAGLGWLMDHIEPLKGWLDQLTGDAAQVAAFAQTWQNVAHQLESSGSELHRILSDVDDLSGEAIDAYRRFQTDAADRLHGASNWASGMATGLTIASQVVAMVHGIVRDAIAKIVGSAISWAAEAVFSVGLATPWIIEQVSTRVASLASSIGTKVTEAVKAIKELSGLLSKLKPLLDEAAKLFRTVLHGTHEGVMALPGVRRLDPRRNKLIADIQKWSGNAAIPGYKPFGDRPPTGFIDTHLKGFDTTGYPDWRWPEAHGFDTSQPIVGASKILRPGAIIDRISPAAPLKDHGEFASPLGTTFPTQSLPPDRLSPGFSHYRLEVLRPLPDTVKIGNIASAFEQGGGGVQYFFPGGIAKWINSGYLKVVP